MAEDYPRDKESNQSKIVVIAGPSGSGKTTIARILSTTYPDDITAVHFDDFQHDVDIIEPDEDGYRNWDNPILTDFNFAFESIKKLKQGVPIQIRAKNEFDNPGFNLGNYDYRPEVDIIPRKVCIVEGHYALVDERIASLANLTLFLNLSYEKSTSRRNKGTDAIYNSRYLEPAHRQIILPSASRAECLIDANDLTSAEVARIVLKHLTSRDFIRPEPE